MTQSWPWGGQIKKKMSDRHVTLIENPKETIETFYLIKQIGNSWKPVLEAL